MIPRLPTLGVRPSSRQLFVAAFTVFEAGPVPTELMAVALKRYVVAACRADTVTVAASPASRAPPKRKCCQTTAVSEVLTRTGSSIVRPRRRELP
jgi:hypothetical protein